MAIGGLQQPALTGQDNPAAMQAFFEWMRQRAAAVQGATAPGRALVGDLARGDFGAAGQQAMENARASVARSFPAPQPIAQGGFEQAMQFVDPSVGIAGTVGKFTPKMIAEARAKYSKNVPMSAVTVRDPQRVAYDVYTDIPGMVRSVKVAPESDALPRLFGGIRRGDLAQMADRRGASMQAPFKMAANPKGAEASKKVMTDRNADRLLSILEETRDNRPDLYQGMKGWYIFDPVYQRIEQLVGKRDAPAVFDRFNTYTAMSSPASDVNTELLRGTAANWLATQGRFGDYSRYGGKAGLPGSPQDMRGVKGHFAHKTAHVKPMQIYNQSGLLDMGSAKVPSYRAASSVPQLGPVNTDWAVGDAHFARGVGLADTRDWKVNKDGRLIVPKDNATNTEMVDIGPWFQEEIATPMGLESVPGQAITWGAASKRTGVDTDVGAPKIELLADLIMKTSKRLGISPEEARDMVLLGKAHAG